ncbi:MAG: DUF4139 domain-containing protein, partial [Pseudomonadales bacterium]|nr:DUF4139 domain-containing protein [Pseudomonadales bacterium]
MKIKRAFSLTLIFGSTLLVSLELQAATVSSIDDQSALAVTIYNSNLALVKDTRKVSLQRGVEALELRGVSAQLRPETALLRSAGSGGLNILEQNFDFDLLTPQKLLEKHLGKQVKIAAQNPATGVEKIRTGTLLSTNSGVVVRIGDRIETNPPGRYIFDALPANLRDLPTLSVLLNNKQNTNRELQLSYLTGGLSWRADYVAELDANDKLVDLNGWVTLSNTSGTDFPNAKLQLVAGDVNLVRQQMQRNVKYRAVAMEMSDAAPAMSEESLLEYHLYTLQRPTDIRDRQNKQVALMSASRVPVQKALVLNGTSYYYRSSAKQIGTRMKFGVFVELENSEKNGLGMPLPKGIVRVYKRDSSNHLQFVGEDSIDHTPNKDKITLKLGDAFDVVADKRQTSFRINDRVLGRDVYDSSYEIVVTNGKKEAVEIIIREPIPGDWKILESSHAHNKVAANLAEWRLSVPAEQKLTLS